MLFCSLTPKPCLEHQHRLTGRPYLLIKNHHKFLMLPNIKFGGRFCEIDRAIKFFKKRALHWETWANGCHGCHRSYFTWMRQLLEITVPPKVLAFLPQHAVLQMRDTSFSLWTHEERNPSIIFDLTTLSRPIFVNIDVIAPIPKCFLWKVKIEAWRTLLPRYLSSVQVWIFTSYFVKAVLNLNIFMV